MARKKVSKISREWIRQTRDEFHCFLKDTKFPFPDRLGARGPALKYPEWLIMFIAILAVKCKKKSYIAIHAMVTQYWDIISADLRLPLISERQLRDRLKKICHFPRMPAAFIFQLFPEWEKEYRC